MAAAFAAGGGILIAVSAATADYQLLGLGLLALLTALSWLFRAWRISTGRTNKFLLRTGTPYEKPQRLDTDGSWHDT